MEFQKIKDQYEQQRKVERSKLRVDRRKRRRQREKKL